MLIPYYYLTSNPHADDHHLSLAAFRTANYFNLPGGTSRERHDPNQMKNQLCLRLDNDWGANGENYTLPEAKKVIEAADDTTFAIRWKCEEPMTVEELVKSINFVVVKLSS
jgi:hypothetical protein